MKNAFYFVALPIYLFLFILVLPASATTSGACSSHDGVNCSVGADYDGSVICNDGWRNSSVQYSSVLACKDSKPMCSIEELKALHDEYHIDELMNELTSITEQVVSKAELLDTSGKLLMGEALTEQNKILAELDALNLKATFKKQEIDNATNVVERQCELLGEINQDAIQSTESESESDSYQYDLESICRSFSHSYLDVNNNCSCQSGYIFNDQINACVDYDSNCQNLYGAHSYGDGEYCYCGNGYTFNSEKTSCIAQNQTANSLPLNSTTNYSPLVDGVTNPSSYKKLEGYILLQVESHGEAWYVYPKTGERYYMKDGDAAYHIMRYFSLGVSEADYEKILSGDIRLREQLRGQIIIRPQAHGEAYYVHPKTLAVYYLENGDAAYQLMRYYSLGITNTDLAKIQPNEI